MLVLALIVALATSSTLWVERRAVLAWIGDLVVEQSELAPADLVVILAGSPALNGREAAAIVTGGYARRVLLLEYRPDADTQLLTRLGLPASLPISTLVMERLGVPRDAIAVTPVAEGRGTSASVLALADYARARGLRRLIVVTSRSHTRRTARLLRQRLDGSTIIVRAPAEDLFRPHEWWRDRDSARELLTEALRWLDSFALGWYGFAH
jgi:uncharacterized SAM-binding protein YcdF (DUF218 family)